MFEKMGIDLKYEPLDLRALIDEVVASLKLQLEKYKATVTITQEGETGFQGDRLHMVSVIFNLLDNALKYSKDEADIRIHLEGDSKNVTLRVEDNGIGIPAVYQDRIFDKFFRVPHGDTHNAKGYGLGLSYVAQVVQKHQGRITVNSEEGKGTAFTIVLPRIPGE
jgi:two-component system phosphate regulon sensor histidine kinase PhoR